MVIKEDNNINITSNISNSKPCAVLLKLKAMQDIWNRLTFYFFLYFRQLNRPLWVSDIFSGLYQFFLKIYYFGVFVFAIPLMFMVTSDTKICDII